MSLLSFIQDLLTTGIVTVHLENVSPPAEDIAKSVELIHQYYKQDILEVPGEAPAFSSNAAAWAAKYFYAAVWLTINRDAGEEIISKELMPFEHEISPPEIYSADLILRHLPALFELAKGLAPADILVQKLKETAACWPFSSVGIALDEIKNEEIILQHQGLACMYADRIIQQKDKTRINPFTTALIYEATGEHLDIFWPGFEPVLN